MIHKKHFVLLIFIEEVSRLMLYFNGKKKEYFTLINEIDMLKDFQLHI